MNHDFDPIEYVENVPHERIVQCHLAGHTNCGTHLVDTHDGKVIDPVWELYRRAHQLTGGLSTLLEWDARIPEFPVVHAEALKAKQHIADELVTATKVDVNSRDELPSSLDAGPIALEPAVPHPAVLVTAEVE